jgi:hypothetical protein
MYSEMKYIKYGQAASIIVAIGYFILFISGLESEKLEIQKRFQKLRSASVDPAKITAVSAWVRLFGFLILAVINTHRAGFLAKEQLHGRKTLELRPQFIVTFGGWISALGSVIEAIGAQEDAQIPRDEIVLE